MGDDPDTPPPRPEACDPDDSAARPKPYGANDSTATPGPRDPNAVAARPQSGDTDGPAARPSARGADGLRARSETRGPDASAARPSARDADGLRPRPPETRHAETTGVRPQTGNTDHLTPEPETRHPDTSAGRPRAGDGDGLAVRPQARDADNLTPWSRPRHPDASAAQSEGYGPDDPARLPVPRHPDASAAQPRAHDLTPRPNPHPPADNLLTRLKAYEGHPAAVAGAGKDPVNLPMIRHWCEALGDANPAYAGPDAVAPPTMLQAWTMGGLTGHTGRSSAYDELLTLLDESGCTSVVATDCEQEYLQPLRPGDRITFDTVIESVSDRKSTKLGAGHFVTTRTDVRVGETLVGTHRFRILKYAPAQPKKTSPRPRRPRPVVNRDNAGFWEGVEQHRLLIQRCTACATLRFPWLPGCAHCGGPDWDTVEASGEGTVHSYVVMHHPPFPAFDPPYAVVLVELAEGVRMISNVVGTPYDKVRIGMPVRLVFRTYDGDLTLPVFRADPEEAAV
ncbi:putative OB-fold protein [Streptomyces sp. SAI-127]|nr:putative OB-fold protein [Streptomyces sp. SAI-127]